MSTLLLTVTVEPDRPQGEVGARTTLENLAGVMRLARLCERLGIQPTWLLTWPALRHAPPEHLERLGRAGELGASLHPWITPPFEPNEDRLRPVCPAAVPASAVAAKLAELTARFTEVTGRRPTAHRAPSAGLDGATLQALERQGFRVDSSATPHLQGPAGTRADWRGAPEIPWFPDRQEPARRGSSPVLQVPVTHEWDRPTSGWLRHALDRWPDEGAAGRLRDRLARPRRLDPLALELPALQGMAERIVARGLPCLNVALRSRELTPGCSRRCPRSEDVERLFATLEGLLRFCLAPLGLTPRGLTAFAEAYLSAAPGGFAAGSSD